MLGCPPECRQIGRSINISDFLRNCSGHGADGDPSVHRETGSLKPGNSDMARQVGMEEARVAVTDWKARRLDHWIKLGAEFQADLAWWEAFFLSWNARSTMEVHHPQWSPTVAFASDASGSWGCGAVWQQTWLQHRWDSAWSSESIAVKELVPIAVARALWGPKWCQ